MKPTRCSNDSERPIGDPIPAPSAARPRRVLQAADRAAPSDRLEWRAVSLGALKVTVLHGQQEQAADGRLVSELLAECVAAHELPVAAVLRGELGLRLRPPAAPHPAAASPSKHLPMVATAIGELDRVRAMLADLDAAARPTLVTVEAARLLDGDLDTGPLARDPEREATRLTVYVGGGEEVGGRPAHQVVVEILLRHGVDGATVLPGVDGTLYGRRPAGGHGAAPRGAHDGGGGRRVRAGRGRAWPRSAASWTVPSRRSSASTSGGARAPRSPRPRRRRRAAPGSG